MRNLFTGLIFIFALFSLTVATVEVCSAGEFYSLTTEKCELCQQGTFAAEDGARTECTPCPVGSRGASVGLTQCLPCRAGTYEVNRTSCKTCPGGTSSLNGSSECFSCPDGYAAYPGEQSCRQCEAGFYSYEKTTCRWCRGGTFSPAGSTECYPCAKGLISNGGQSKCYPCMAGRYAVEGIFCEVCPFRSTSVAGSTYCTCESGYVPNEDKTECIKKEEPEPPKEEEVKPTNSGFTLNVNACVVGGVVLLIVLILVARYRKNKKIDHFDAEKENEIDVKLMSKDVEKL